MLGGQTVKLPIPKDQLLGPPTVSGEWTRVAGVYESSK